MHIEHPLFMMFPTDTHPDPIFLNPAAPGQNPK